MESGVSSKVIHAHDLVKRLIDAGIVPSNCTRVVIDLPIDDAARLYFECIGDERLIDVLSGDAGIKISERQQSAIAQPDHA